MSRAGSRRLVHGERAGANTARVDVEEGEPVAAGEAGPGNDVPAVREPLHSIHDEVPVRQRSKPLDRLAARGTLQLQARRCQAGRCRGKRASPPRSSPSRRPSREVADPHGRVRPGRMGSRSSLQAASGQWRHASAGAASAAHAAATAANAWTRAAGAGRTRQAVQKWAARQAKFAVMAVDTANGVQEHELGRWAPSGRTAANNSTPPIHPPGATRQPLSPRGDDRDRRQAVQKCKQLKRREKRDDGGRRRKLAEQWVEIRQRSRPRGGDGFTAVRTGRDPYKALTKTGP